MPALSTTMGHEPGLYELLAALPSQLQPHVSRPEDSTFLQSMFRERSLHSLIKIHTRLQLYEEIRPLPAVKSVSSLVSQLCDELQGKTSSGDAKELLALLSRPHVKSLLSVHDTVAQKNYDPELPPLPDDLDDDEDSVKIIRLVKNKEPLGATIRKDEDTGAITIARIMRGGAADRSGLIHVGDELKEVNGIPVEDKTPEEIIRILAQSQGAITFKVVPGSKEEAPVKEPKVFMKALFDYNPLEDKAIPCREAGLAFARGSVLHIVSQDDPTWWQAKVQGEANPRAGLIPSKQFQERRFAVRQPVSSLPTSLRSSTRRTLDPPQACSSSCGISLDDVEVEFEDADSGGLQAGASFRRSFRLSRRDKKTNKSMYECKKSELYDTADVPTYEEVTQYRRATGARHRLVVLVGPTGVGMNSLKRKLLISDPQHFSVTIPHTSRPKKNQETDGVEYHFIAKHLFETDIHNNKFIEYGEYKGNYYGTSLDSIRSVLSKNKVCLIDIQPHSIKHLRTAEFKPFVVFVKPPALDRLRETRQNAQFVSGKDDKANGRTFTEEDFQEMVRAAQNMEAQYGHLFEKVIVNDDLSAAFGELRLALKCIETDEHWVPVSWTHS